VGGYLHLLTDTHLLTIFNNAQTDSQTFHQPLSVHALSDTRLALSLGSGAIVIYDTVDHSQVSYADIL
jgi:hypothetical protein